MSFVGFVQLSDTIHIPVQTRNTSQVPINADAAPRFRVFAGTGLLTATADGTATNKHTGSVTGATNASPIVITSAAHGLSTGQRVTVTGVGGNTNANGTFNVTRVSADTFSLDGSTGNGAYTSGGSWNTAGFYDCSIDCTSGNGFVAGETYTLHVSWLISSSARADAFTFTVT